MTDWRAVFIGFLVVTVFGIIGLVVPGIGQLAAGLIGGFVAGYMAGGGLGSGFWHGLLAGSLGGIIGGLLIGVAVGLAGIALGPLGGAIAGTAGLGIFALAVAISLFMALESAVAGTVGAAVRT
ncbi:DUF5518 domain-containing protein [Natrinema gelatinilyticum]|uniref:DUF5518 domain-containing protein n=1 Tax=Natrinema gelatinilyticum TaxID=2961571 RepID=UPI0020C4F09C|nr:DUF5518 domain-containing protein [Natrinema gelatinilyticum]